MYCLYQHGVEVFFLRIFLIVIIKTTIIFTNTSCTLLTTDQFIYLFLHLFVKHHYFSYLQVENLLYYRCWEIPKLLTHTK